MESDLKAANAIVYAISNEAGGSLKAMKEKAKLGDTFQFLTDPKGEAAAKYAGKLDNGILIPAVFVIAPSGKITYAYVNKGSIAERAKPEDVLAAVKKKE